MDQQKTGALIARQRKELGLTQKALAEKLQLSDRTISKWERGAGFPDVSLIEPLADALNLTVLELIHGQLETPAPEQESSAREMLNVCRPQMEQNATRSRRFIIAMAVALAILIASLPWLITTAHGQWLASSNITAEEAVGITPLILISTADNELLDRILENEAVAETYNTSFSDRLYLTGSDTASYQDLVSIHGETPLFMDIVVYCHDLTVSYGTRDTHIVLGIRKNEVSKQVIVCEYPYLTESGTNIPMGQRHGNRADLNNQNNETFQKSGYQTGWLELFRTTYY